MKTGTTPEKQNPVSHSAYGVYRGAPGRSRTYNPQIRSLMLYPLSYQRSEAQSVEGNPGRQAYKKGSEIHAEITVAPLQMPARQEAGERVGEPRKRACQAQGQKLGQKSGPCRQNSQ